MGKRLALIKDLFKSLNFRQRASFFAEAGSAVDQKADILFPEKMWCLIFFFIFFYSQLNQTLEDLRLSTEWI